jgi:light-harvesting complex I chlorophyll a/b binding protein 1
MLSFTNTRVPTAFTCTKKAARSVRVRSAEPEKVPGTGGDVFEYAKGLPGISQPFPNMFDPANFLGNADNKVSELRRWRESEVTHGRVAMLASLGFITQEVIEDKDFDRKSPFFPHVSGPAIGHFQQVEAQGAVFWVPLLFAIGLAESYRVQVGWQNPTSKGFNKLYDDDTYIPGDLSFDPLGLYPTDPKEQYDLKTKELNNGRLAMIAIAGFVAQELVNKKEIIETARELIGGTKNA